MMLVAVAKPVTFIALIIAEPTHTPHDTWPPQ